MSPAVAEIAVRLMRALFAVGAWINRLAYRMARWAMKPGDER